MEGESTAAQLTPEAARELIRQQRIPLISRVTTGNRYDRRDGMTVFIPPQGTQLGDTIEGDGIRTGMSFISPQGEVRGVAALQFLPIEEGQKVREAIEKALRSEGIDKSSETAYTLMKLRRWFWENLLT